MRRKSWCRRCKRFWRCWDRETRFDITPSEQPSALSKTTRFRRLAVHERQQYVTTTRRYGRRLVHQREIYAPTCRRTILVVIILRKRQVTPLIFAGIQVHRKCEFPERSTARRVIAVAATPADGMVVAGDQNSVGLRSMILKRFGNLRRASAKQGVPQRPVLLRVRRDHRVAPIFLVMIDRPTNVSCGIDPSDRAIDGWADFEKFDQMAAERVRQQVRQHAGIVTTLATSDGSAIGRRTFCTQASRSIRKPDRLHRYEIDDVQPKKTQAGRETWSFGRSNALDRRFLTTRRQD